MKLGIMQPYIFPYIGYWQVIFNTDRWIFFDTVQYNKRSWMNRNRILHPDSSQDFQYITVPIKKLSRGTLIKDAKINQVIKWKEKILGQLTVYKRLHAPYYDEVLGLVKFILESAKNPSFLEFCIISTVEICRFLQIEFNYKIASQTEFDRDKIITPGDWALEICKAQQAEIYINPYSGYEIFDELQYQKNNIELRFLKPELIKYRQSKREKFIPSLSIIDVMMFNGFSGTEKFIKNKFLIYKKDELIEALQGEKRGSD